jgi:transposase
VCAACSRSDAQLELLQWEPGVSNVEVQAESERAAEPAWTDKPHKRKHPGRQEVPADLPRREKVLACTPEQCTCRACGQQTMVIGYDRSEQLDVEPQNSDRSPGDLPVHITKEHAEGQKAKKNPSS